MPGELFSRLADVSSTPYEIVIAAAALSFIH